MRKILQLILVCTQTLVAQKYTLPLDSIMRRPWRDNMVEIPYYCHRLWPDDYNSPTYHALAEKYMISAVMLKGDTLNVFTTSPEIFENKYFEFPTAEDIQNKFKKSNSDIYLFEDPYTVEITNIMGDSICYIGYPPTKESFSLNYGKLYSNEVFMMSKKCRIGGSVKLLYEYLNLNKLGIPFITKNDYWIAVQRGRNYYIKGEHRAGTPKDFFPYISILSITKFSQYTFGVKQYIGRMLFWRIYYDTNNGKLCNSRQRKENLRPYNRGQQP